jgi:hypothetical protein
MITGRIHVFSFAGGKNVHAIHGSFDLYWKELKTIQLGDGYWAVATLAGRSIFAWGTRRTRFAIEKGAKNEIMRKTLHN